MGSLLDCLTCCGCCKWIAEEVTCMHKEYDDTMEMEYHHILKFKGMKAVWYRPPKSKLSIAQTKFKEDMAKGKVVYHNDYFEDLYFYARNNHPYFSPWTAELHHPFSRSERLVVVMVTLFLSICLAFWRAGIIDYDRQQGKEDEDYNTKSEIAATKIGFAILSPSLLWIFSYILGYCGTCRMAQGSNCASCRSCCERLSHLAMCLISSFVMFWVIIIIALYASNPRINSGFVLLNFLYNLAVASLVTAPILLIVMYEWKRRRDVSANNKSLDREAETDHWKHKYNIPVSWYLEWKSAGKPQYNGDGPLTQEDMDKANGKWVNRAKKVRDTLRSKTGIEGDSSFADDIAAAQTAEAGMYEIPPMTPQMTPSNSVNLTLQPQMSASVDLSHTASAPPMMNPGYHRTYSHSSQNLGVSGGVPMVMLTPGRSSAVLSQAPTMITSMSAPATVLAASQQVVHPSQPVIQPIQAGPPTMVVLAAGPGSQRSITPVTPVTPVVYHHSPQPSAGMITTYVQPYTPPQ